MKDFYDGRVKLAQPLMCQRHEYGFIYESKHANFVNDLLTQFDKAKGRLGIEFQGSVNDIRFVEIPGDQDLIKDGLPKNSAGVSRLWVAGYCSGV